MKPQNHSKYSLCLLFRALFISLFTSTCFGQLCLHSLTYATLYFAIAFLVFKIQLKWPLSFETLLTYGSSEKMLKQLKHFLFMSPCQDSEGKIKFVKVILFCTYCLLTQHFNESEFWKYFPLLCTHSYLPFISLCFVVP